MSMKKTMAMRDMFKEFVFNDKPEKEIYCQIDSCNIGDDTYYTISDSFGQFLIHMDEEPKADDPIDLSSRLTYVVGV